MLDAYIVKARDAFTLEVRLRLLPGERLALFGASGVGKSTLLSCIAGLETPDSGEVRLNGLRLFPPSLPLHRRPLAYLTQGDFLFPHLSVAENVCFGLGGHRNGTQKWLDELRERLKLEAIWDQPATRISGGQSRRVALARMLARQPPLVLLDEPFTALDIATTNDLVAALLEWQLRCGFILIAVDHRSEILSRLCSKTALMEAGRIVRLSEAGA
ncbi:MAG: ATP-binding cassette domain-containing protein [Candidatus Binataceae bacterium]